MNERIFRTFTRWRSKSTMLVALLAVVALVAAACGSEDPTAAPTAAPPGTSAPDTPTDDLSSLSGDVDIDGSSTVFPISEAVAEEFRSVAPRVRVQVGVSGTGGGFKRFCAGETDISDASRPIKSSEREICAANGVEFVEMLVGWDGLSVVVNPGNDFVDDLSIEELKKIYEPGSTVNNWNQVRASFPDEELTIFAPDVDSGTFDFFTDEVVGEEGASRSDYTASSDDNVLVQGISGERGAKGYFGYAYYAENQDKLKVLGVDGVVPNEETILSGEYPLTRPLFIYVREDSLANKQHVAEFVKFYIANAPELVADVDYVPVSTEQYDSARGAIARILGVPAIENGLSGDVDIDGSSTVFPISEAVAEEFRSVNSSVRVQVGVSGTGGGFKRFCAGETDISDASRPIKSSEREICAANGVEFVEMLVGWDGLSVVVNPDNDFVDDLSIEELKKVYEPGSTVNNWNQVRASFPDEELTIFAPDVDSGTFDFFTDEVVGEEGASRSDYTASSDDNVLVQGISGEKGAKGYFGYAYYAENQDKLKVLGVDGVVPNEETILSGEYPLTRPLFIYVRVDSLVEKPHVREFVRFYIENSPELVADVDYVPVSTEQYDAARGAIARLTEYGL